MKTISKKLLALFCAAALTLGLSVTSFAAETSTFSVAVGSSEVQLIQNGKVAASYPLYSAEISLYATNDYPLVLSFMTTASQKKNVSLGSQKALTISGVMSSLTLDKSLASDLGVTLGAKSSLAALTVHSASSVVVADDATVSKVASSNKNASIMTASGKTVTASTAKAVASTRTATTKKTTTGSSSSSTGLTLSTKAINADVGDSLSDLLDELNDNVTARNSAGDTVYGECEWISKTDRTISDDTSMSFTFTAPSYAATTGTIKIYADGVSEDTTIRYHDYTSDSPLIADDGDRLSDFTSDVKDNITVENDDGDEIEYTFKWNSGNSTRFDGTERSRGYGFTVTPKNSRYAAASGTIYIVGSDVE